MTPKLFISYATEDQPMAETLVQYLSKNKILAFMNIRPQSVGDNWERHLKNELNLSSHFLFVLSDKFINSYGAMQELGAAIAMGVPIVPILIGKPKIPINIDKYVVLDMSENNMEEAMEIFRNATIQGPPSNDVIHFLNRLAVGKHQDDI